MSDIRTATLEITLNCNFKCSHCYIETVSKGGDDLKVSDWIKIIDRLRGVDCNNYILTGGEVMMSSSFIDVYRYLKKNNCRVDIFTNGSILKKIHRELFEEIPPDSVSITLYGKNSDQYEAVTGCSGAILKKIENNIETLRSMGINVNLGTILCKGIDLGSESDNQLSVGSFEMNTYMIPSLYGKHNLEQRLTAQDIVNIEIQNPERDKSNREFYSSLDPIRKDSEDYVRKCPGGYSSVFVSASGFISSCAIYRKESFDLLDEHVSMTDILSGLLDVHEKFKYIYFNSKCGDCALNRNCRNCPAYSILETGHSSKNPYLCELAILRAKQYLPNY